MSNPLAALQHIAYTTNTPEEKKCLKLNLLIGHLAISISRSSLCVMYKRPRLENAIDFCRLAFVQVAHFQPLSFISVSTVLGKFN